MGHSEEYSTAGRWIVRIGNGIEKGSGIFGVTLFGMMLISALLGVFFRYVMKSPFQWTEEVARYSLIWLGFMAINMGIWRGEHIAVDVLVQHLPGFMIKALALLVNILCGFFLVVLFYKGCLMTGRTMMTAQSFPVSMFWFYLAVPVSAGLSLIQTVLCSIRLFLVPNWRPETIGG